MWVYLLLAVAFVFSAWVFYRLTQGTGEGETLLPRIGRVGWLLLLALLVLVWLPFGVTLPLLIPVALIFSYTWAPSLMGWLFRPIWAVFDGGHEEVEPKPFYHRAIAQRNKGHYDLAVHEVMQQIAEFPGDFEGMMLVAELQSEELADVVGAIQTLNQIIDTPGRSDREQILALNRIADLHVRREDRASARNTFLRIINGWPRSDAAHFAETRIAHLPTDEVLAALRKTPTVAMREFPQNIGLLAPPGSMDAPYANANERATELLNRLTKRPDDWEAREALAILYGNHFRRADLANDQFERLVNLPKQSEKAVARWMNQWADLHLGTFDDLAAARAVLEQLRQRFPGSIWADSAQHRLARIGTGTGGVPPPKTLKLGNYEQNIGLKQSSPFKQKSGDKIAADPGS
ncbi:MAG: hypothetical protein EXS36_10290 [Pedosphaera sp.]|nr:hypothetical protein [Pedosphaera sp.]